MTTELEPEPVCRIDSDDKGLDDVAIGPVETFRLERMSKRSWWCAVYMADGSRHVVWLRGDKKGRITGEHHKEPSIHEMQDQVTYTVHSIPEDDGTGDPRPPDEKENQP